MHYNSGAIPVTGFQLNVSSVCESCADIICVFFSFCFAERVKHKSDSATKLMNKANSAAAKVTTSNGNGALNRYQSLLDFYPSKQGVTTCTSFTYY